MKAKLMGLLKDEEGQGMVEYGIILGLISIVALVTIGLIGPKVKAYFDNANAAM